MKKLIIIVLIAIVAFVLWKTVGGENDSTVSKSPQSTSGSVIGKPDPSDSTFEFEDGLITLKNGSSEGSNDAFSQVTTLSNTIGYGDVNADGKEDAVVVLFQEGGGSGVFVYVAGYVSGPLDHKGTNAVFVGDRIEPKSIAINNSVITFTYLDRGPQESFATEPSITVTKQFVYTQGKLSEKK